MKTKTEFLKEFHSQPHIHPDRTLTGIVDVVFDSIENDVRRIVPWIDFVGRTGKTTLLLAIAKFIDRKVIYVTGDSHFGKTHGLDGRAWSAMNLRGYGPDCFIIMDTPMKLQDRKSVMKWALFNEIVSEIVSPGILVMP
jgi:hypothetical protein